MFIQIEKMKNEMNWIQRKIYLLQCHIWPLHARLVGTSSLQYDGGSVDVVCLFERGTVCLRVLQKVCVMFLLFLIPFEDIKFCTSYFQLCDSVAYLEILRTVISALVMIMSRHSINLELSEFQESIRLIYYHQFDV
ncbi:hypothetical protein BUALT_Bualt04G0076800 [Buddleja alternifolia]|uniref:Uncharacterized protein n=1 Tax=Buddleja alternifolia TaxID=168488 RepID=A0AAV6XM35_9LAMI|nr:hypothetical protein BUALT_Bualt04G0076800 [Buddleja alternifolia]